MKLKNKIEAQQLLSLIIVSATFLLALAILDYSAMHLRWGESELYWLYKYWMSLSLVVAVFAFALSYVGYVAGMPKRYIPAVFATVVLMFVAGLLDMFYYAFATLQNRPYSFRYWSFQWKVLVENGVLPTWGWPHQIVWALGCIAVIGYVWYRTLKKR